MSAERRSTVADVLSLYKTLSAEERRSVREEILRSERQGAKAAVESDWYTLIEAAASLGKSKAQVSRDIQSGKLIGNKRKGRHLRVLRYSVALAHLREAKRFAITALDDSPLPKALASMIVQSAAEYGRMLSKSEERWITKKLQDPKLYREVLQNEIIRLEKEIELASLILSSVCDRYDLS